MSATATPSIESDVEVINLDAFEFEVPCSFEQCPNEADWYLLCSVCRAAEPLCAGDRKYVEDHVYRIHFNESCGHTPLVEECGWEPAK